MDRKKDILIHSGETNLSFTELIIAIIYLYGTNGDIKPDSIVATQEEISIESAELKKLLNDILTKDGADMAWFIHNTPLAREKLNWHYDTVKGEGYITENT